MKRISLLLVSGLACFGQTFAKAPVATICNVVGNGVTDDTVAIQACINSAPDDSEVMFPTGAQMVISSTINVNGRYGLKILGEAGAFGGPSAFTSAPTFYWNGPGGGTMWSFNRSDNCIMEALTLYTTMGYPGGTGGANIGISVDKTLPTGGTGTNDDFEHITILSGDANPNFQGIVFAQVSQNNIEHMTVRDSIFYCSYPGSSEVGQGIVIGPGGFYNAKKHLYENNKFSNCAYGVYLTGGSADILNNKFEFTAVSVYANPMDSIMISGSDAENIGQFFTGPLTSPITMSNNRIAAANPPTGEASVWITSGGASTLTFQGNIFESDTSPSFMPVGFSSSNTGGSLDSSGNTYPYGTNILGGFYTVPYVLTSRNDTYASTLFTVDGGHPEGFLMGGGYFHHIGGIVYDDGSERWKISNEMSNTTYSTGHMIVSEPAASFTLSGSTSVLGSCGAANDLVSSPNGADFTSATISFVGQDAGGYIHVNPGNGWTGGDYYITSANHYAAISDAVPNLSGGSFTVNRGRIVLVQGTQGVTDTMWVCGQTASGFAWRQIF